ncbi:glutamate--cysteine ligase [Asticcacaulis biprosthecium C19]|uniref:Glutamate--cysteine ligase n=1 Tax=Asticcacaulis biprosthecium C19 TaxID=715226 RepID=F4QSY6_9CAUL|nr:glutamate--cysteine ligase [Asticcacaulis biprosthecium]EGF89856.1 glutamate--cysteine ligase [Asticcacaulis biprosthecium C19]
MAYSGESEPLRTFSELVSYFQSGEKSRERWRIGAEHEKFAFRLTDLTRPAYEGPDGIQAMLKGLMRFGWQGVYEGETLIALSRNGASVSLEPGGQFELSGAPLETVHDICDETGQHLEEVRAVASELGLGFVGTGFSPLWTRGETPVMPKGRYKIMRSYMPKVGNLGLDMMLRTCTVQANLDYSSEADMVQKFRVSLALQPIATALFANSPFTEGKPNGFVSARANVWTDTDPDRTGMLDFVFEDGFGYERYAQYALDVPMYFVHRDDYIDASGQDFKAFMKGELPAYMGHRPTMDDWADHLTTLFPEVRLKKYLEMRGADAGPWSRLCALPALWGGLFYDQTALDAAWDLVKGWTTDEHNRLRGMAARTGLRGDIAGRPVKDWAMDVLNIAKQGLKNRNKLSGGFIDETGYLGELFEIADSGLTPADRLLEKFHGPWQGDIRRLYAEEAY